MKTIGAESDFDTLRRHANAWAVIVAWARYGLFDALASGAPVPAGELPANADAVGIPPRFSPIGILIGTHNPMESLRGRTTARELMDWAFPTASAWSGLDDLSRLHTVLEHGGPIHDREGRSKVTSGGVVRTDEKRTRDFMDMLHRRSEHSHPNLHGSCCHGSPKAKPLIWAVATVATGTKSPKTDWSHPVRPRHCCRIVKERYPDQIETIAGDFMVDELGGPYDPLCSATSCRLGPDELEILIPKLRAALVPGGVLAIKDMFLDHTMARPESAAMFGLTMLLYTSAGRSYTYADMKNALLRSDFIDFDIVDFRDQRFSVILAR